MAKILRAMTRDGSARAFVINSTDIVNEAVRIHRPTPTATALIGRLLSACSMLGSSFSEENDTVTLVINSLGDAGRVVAVSDYMGNVRGYIHNPSADRPLRADGKLDVAGIVGGGTLSIIKDEGENEPSVGSVELVSGEVAIDIANYFAKSEQVPTLCALGVLVDVDHSCKAAGGIIVQLLPFADEGTVDLIERNSADLTNVSGMIDKGMTNEEILAVAFRDIEFDVFDEYEVSYKCTCNEERTKKALLSLGEKELDRLFAEQLEDNGCDYLTVECKFCDKRYEYRKSDFDGDFLTDKNSEA